MNSLTASVVTFILFMSMSVMMLNYLDTGRFTKTLPNSGLRLATVSLPAFLFAIIVYGIVSADFPQ